MINPTPDVPTSKLLPALKELIGFLNIEIRVDRFLSTRWFFKTRRKVVVYLRRLISIAVEAVVLIAVIWVCCGFLLYLCGILWRLYLETPMGEQYLQAFPGRADIIDQIVDYNPWDLAAEATVSAFLICMGISAAGHFLHINPYLYWSRGFFGKLFLWGTGLTAVVTYYLFLNYDVSTWHGIAMVAAVPTCCMFWNCYDYSERLFPEFGDILGFISTRWKRMKEFVRSALEE